MAESPGPKVATPLGTSTLKVSTRATMTGRGAMMISRGALSVGEEAISVRKDVLPVDLVQFRHVGVRRWWVRVH